ncbi:MAG: DNA recombination protein RmuC [Actinomycetia bacterium]|nr:DNA recombination protein RmuC [Actinomycetes bacterium]
MLIIVLVSAAVLVLVLAVAGLAARELLARGRAELDAERHALMATVDTDRRAVLNEAVRVLRDEREVDRRTTLETVVNVAGAKLGDQLEAGSRELDHRNEVVGEQVREMRSELHRLRELMGSLDRERNQQASRLEKGLAEAVRTSTHLADTTRALQEALASPKARGQWGERMADDVLRAAGFVEGVNYRKQTALPTGTIPDFTFFLPQDRMVHMDVKFPIDNYLRFLRADEDFQRDAHRTAFARDVRNRIKELGGRDYIDPASTTDYVLLFIPNESVYGFLHENDSELVDLALGRKVVLCSPFSLFAVLAVIRQAIDSYQLARTSDEILECLGSFSTQWGKFTDSMETVGKRLESTQKAFGDLSGTRRRQLERQIDEIDRLRNRRDAPGTDQAEVAPSPEPETAGDRPWLREIAG